MRVSINIIAQFISCMMISGIAFADSGIMSKYGTIQGVDGYSTNPFGSSNTSTYSNRMPVPVYENGPDVQTDECLKIVSNFVSAQCNALNNCADTSLSDIRPAIILQLSRMSGGNYATSCSGYLDEIFRQYKQAHQTPGASATFPTPSTTAKAATTNTNKSAVPLNNFFDAQKPAWAIEMQERTTELAEFQADNDRFYPELVPMDFPKTYADLSFGERMANNKAGYEPYQGKSAFKPIQVEDLDKYEKRQDEIAKAKQDRDKASMKIEDFCKKYPNDATCVQREADAVAAKIKQVNDFIASVQSFKDYMSEECKNIINELESKNTDPHSTENSEAIENLLTSFGEKKCLDDAKTKINETEEAYKKANDFIASVKSIKDYMSEECKNIINDLESKNTEPHSTENLEAIENLLDSFGEKKCSDNAKATMDALSISCTDIDTYLKNFKAISDNTMFVKEDFGLLVTLPTKLNSTHLNKFKVVEEYKTFLDKTYKENCLSHPNGSFIPNQTTSEKYTLIKDSYEEIKTSIINQATLLVEYFTFGKFDDNREYFTTANIINNDACPNCEPETRTLASHIEVLNENCAICYSKAYLKHIIPDINVDNLHCSATCSLIGDDIVKCRLTGFKDPYGFIFDDICD